MIQTVRVNASAPYDVSIGDGLLARLGSLLTPIAKSNRVMLVADDAVNARYGGAAADSLAEAGFCVFRHVFPHGEASKTLETLGGILEDAAERRLTRRDLFVALGGGVTGDMTGFAASVYMRGIDFAQVPTTLLASVDASVGGKTAVDLAHGKNLAGTFWQPRAVLCDTDVIRGLPEREFQNGMGEVIKHGVIAGPDILEAVERGEEKTRLAWLIRRNVEIKKAVVEADERESGRRMILNFGHTVAHAIEKTSGYRIAHGAAVGAGMVCETRLAEGLGLCARGLAERIDECCRRCGCTTPVIADAAFVDAMTLDKKNRNGRIAFALPRRIGEMTLAELSKAEVLAALLPTVGA